MKDHQFTLVWPFFVVILGLGSICRVFSRSVKTLAGCFVLFASCLTSDDILPLDIPVNIQITVNCYHKSDDHNFVEN